MIDDFSNLSIPTLAGAFQSASFHPGQAKEHTMTIRRHALSRWMPATALAACLLGGATAAAATWATPGASGTWNTPGNWSPAVVPQDVDVVIDGETGSNSTVSLDVNATVNNLTVSSGDLLTVNVSPSILTIDGRTTPVTVDNQGTIRLDGNVAGGKGLNIEGTVNWQGNGLSVVGNQNNTQFRIQTGAQLTIPSGTAFSFNNQTWCNGTVINHGTFQIGGLFLGGSGSQINGGTMRFSSRMGFNVTNYVGSTQGALTLGSGELEQSGTVDGGTISFSAGTFKVYRSGIGNTLTLNGTNTTSQVSGAIFDLIRSSTISLDAAGSYDFDGTLIMDVVDAGKNSNSGRWNSNATISAKNGTVTLNGDGSLAMTAGVLGTFLRHSILTGAAATDGFVNNLAGGISGAGKIGNNAISFVNHTLIDATDATYALELDPIDSGSFVNSATGTLRASGAGGLILRAGSYSNAGVVEALALSSITIDSGATLDSSGLIDIAGTLAVAGQIDLTLTDGVDEGLVIRSSAAGVLAVDVGTGGIHVVFAQDFAPGTAYPSLLAITMAGDHVGYLQGMLDSGLLTYDVSAISPQYLDALKVIHLGGTTVFGFIPEPASGLLLGLAGLVALRRRRG